nr:hypothetical protein GCSOEBMH_GCSOEBMH_CDS_0051 [uncultured phage]
MSYCSYQQHAENNSGDHSHEVIFHHLLLFILCYPSGNFRNSPSAGSPLQLPVLLWCSGQFPSSDCPVDPIF